MSIINNNSFTLDAWKQAILNNAAANLGVNDIKVGAKYGNMFPIYDDKDDDRYLCSYDFETMAEKHDLSALADSFFVGDTIKLELRASEVEYSENLQLEIVELIEKKMEALTALKEIHVDADSIEEAAREGRKESVEINNCLFEITWDWTGSGGDVGEYFISYVDFLSHTNYNGIVLFDTPHENNGSAYNWIEWDLVQRAGGSFSTYAQLKGAVAVVKVSGKNDSSHYFLAA